jgi:hypothetical protein
MVKGELRSDVTYLMLKDLFSFHKEKNFLCELPMLEGVKSMMKSP